MSLALKKVKKMNRFWNEASLKEELTHLTIIIDSREQRNEHIRAFFDKNNIPYVVRKLDSGDYSAMLGDMTLEPVFFSNLLKSILVQLGHYLTMRTSKQCNCFQENNEESYILKKKKILQKTVTQFQRLTGQDHSLEREREVAQSCPTLCNPMHL